MLTLYGSDQARPIEKTASAGDPDATIPAGVTWIDAFEPTPEEVGLVERAMGSRVPSLQELSEIETSSRLATDGETLLMSLPATTRDTSGFPLSTPIGFVLNRNRLATIRFAHLPVFERLATDAHAKGQAAGGGLGAMVNLLELIIDHLADVLERIGGDLDGISRQVFTQGLAQGRGRPHRTNQVLAGMLKVVGETGEVTSKVSESLLGINRIVPFLGGKVQDAITPDLRIRLDTVAQDARSLREYEEHLSSKTQFMLDTILGLANIEQNNVFRVLTVVSVVGIPPTFFASMYGMNFKGMPEYDWTYGYAYGLTLIALSGLLPAIWFKVKGWW